MTERTITQAIEELGPPFVVTRPQGGDPPVWRGEGWDYLEIAPGEHERGIPLHVYYGRRFFVLMDTQTGKVVDRFGGCPEPAPEGEEMTGKDVMIERVLDDAARTTAMLDQAAKEGFLLVPKNCKPKLLERIRRVWDAHAADAQESVEAKEGGAMPDPARGLNEHGPDCHKEHCVDAPPDVAERMDKLPPKGLLRAARAMGEGMKYEGDLGAHWMRQGPDYHLNRALRHIALYQAGDNGEEHVGHAVARLLMWGALVE